MDKERQYANSIQFNKIAENLGKEIKSCIISTLEYHQNSTAFQLKDALKSAIDSRMKSLCNSPSMKQSPMYSDFEIKHLDYRSKVDNNGKFDGILTITSGYKQDNLKYGGPGYPGCDTFMLWEDSFGKVHKWHKSTERWYLLKDHPDHKWKMDETKRKEEESTIGWKLKNVAIFESPYGTNPKAVGDALSSSRRTASKSGLWGDPGFGKKPGGSTWKQFTGVDIKNVMRMSMNFAAIVKLWDKFDELLEDEDSPSIIESSEHKTVERDSLIRHTNAIDPVTGRKLGSMKKVFLSDKERIVDSLKIKNSKSFGSNSFNKQHFIVIDVNYENIQ